MCPGALCRGGAAHRKKYTFNGCLKGGNDSTLPGGRTLFQKLFPGRLHCGASKEQTKALLRQRGNPGTRGKNPENTANVSLRRSGSTLQVGPSALVLGCSCLMFPLIADEPQVHPRSPATTQAATLPGGQNKNTKRTPEIQKVLEPKSICAAAPALDGDLFRN